MKKKFLIFPILTFCLVIMSVGCSFTKSKEEPIYEIPTESIKYNGIEFGNVIDEGKRAVFMKFESDYAVVKMEIAGVAIATNGDTLYEFDFSTNFGNNPTNPRPAIRLDKDLITRVSYISFTKILAYTNEVISSNE